MKLSDVKGERAFEVIAELVEPIAVIAKNKAFMELFERKKLPEGTNTTDFILKRAEKAIPALLKDNKNEVIKVLSVIKGVDEEEYLKNLNLQKLFKDVFELITDKEFIDFLS